MIKLDEILRECIYGRGKFWELSPVTFQHLSKEAWGRAANVVKEKPREYDILEVK